MDRVSITAFVLLALINLIACHTINFCHSPNYYEELESELSSDSWELEIKEKGVEVYSRQTAHKYHTAREFKARITNIPASSKEIFSFLFESAYSKDYLQVFSQILHGEVIERFSNQAQMVYEIHNIPEYISMYPGIIYRDWLVSRCSKKLSENEYLIFEQSAEDNNYPNKTKIYQRGWNINSAVIIKSTGEQQSEIVLYHHQTLMCCIPQSIYNVHQGNEIYNQLLKLREYFGGWGRCHNDMTSPDEFHASCHLALDFQVDCKNVFAKIISNANKQQSAGLKPGYLFRSSHSNQYCLDFVHFGYTFYIADDIHFEIIDRKNNFCSIRASSRSQSVSHYDFATNYCNIINLLDTLEYNSTVSSCLYRPRGDSAKTYCKNKDLSGIVSTMNFFEDLLSL